MNPWAPSKYNRYKITTEHGISQVVYASDATTARKDFEVVMPSVGIDKIQFFG